MNRGRLTVDSRINTHQRTASQGTSNITFAWSTFEHQARRPSIPYGPHCGPTSQSERKRAGQWLQVPVTFQRSRVKDGTVISHGPLRAHMQGAFKAHMMVGGMRALMGPWLASKPWPSVAMLTNRTFGPTARLSLASIGHVVSGPPLARRATKIYHQGRRPMTQRYSVARADTKDLTTSSKFSGSCVLTLQTLPVDLGSQGP